MPYCAGFGYGGVCTAEERQRVGRPRRDRGKAKAGRKAARANRR